MDFINKTVAQLTELFGSMSPGARIFTGLLLAAVVVSLGWLTQMGSSSANDFLHGNREFSQSDLASMERAFGKAGLNDFEIVGNRMKVPHSTRSEYLRALDDSGVTFDAHGVFHEQVDKGDNPFRTRQQLEMMSKTAKQRELALIIRRMRDVEAATVEFDEVVKAGFPRTVEKTALVAVKPVGDRYLDENLVMAVRKTVAGSIAGLRQENVTVTDMNAGIAYSGPGEGGIPSAADDPYASRKRMYEEVWRQKIHTRLAMIPGVVVGVNVELDNKLSQVQSTVKYDPKTVALSMKESGVTVSSNSAAPGGRPGAVPNGVSNSSQQVAASTGNSSQSQREETSSEQQAVAAQRDHTTSQLAALIPTKVTASIDVPSSYYVQVWREKFNHPPEKEPEAADAKDVEGIEEATKLKIQSAVVGLIPKQPEGVDPYPQVAVTTYTSLPQEPLPEPGIMENAQTWLGANWQAIGMIFVGLAGLFFLRGMLKSPAGEGGKPSSAASSLLPAEALAQFDAAAASGATGAAGGKSSDENGTDSAGNRVLRRSQAGGPDLKTELTEMVRESPDAALNVLRNWIGEAA